VISVGFDTDDFIGPSIAKYSSRSGIVMLCCLFNRFREGCFVCKGRKCYRFCISIQYDTRCYFSVRSKADISQFNLPRGTDN